MEAGISLGSAWHSHSPALFAFGGDSLVELISAAVIFWRFGFDAERGTCRPDCRGIAFRAGGTRSVRPRL